MRGAAGELPNPATTFTDRVDCAAHNRRLFFALWPDGQQRTVLAHAARQAVEANGGRAVPAANLHATLVFLGTVPEARLARVAAVASHVAERFPRQGLPLQLTFSRLELWKKPRVLCAVADPVAAENADGTMRVTRAVDGGGVAQAPCGAKAQAACVAAAAGVAIAALADTLRDQLLKAGFDLDLKPFRAHVTLARQVRDGSGAYFIEPTLWRFERFALIESRTEDGGALYSVVDSWELGSAQNA